MGGTCLCAPSPGQPFGASRTGHTWDRTFTQGPSGQPLHAIPLEQSLCVQLVKPAEKRVSSDSLGLAVLYKIPYHNWRWFLSHKNWLSSGGSVCLTIITPGSHPAVLQWLDSGLDLPAEPETVFNGHAGDLLTGMYRVQDVLITTVCLYGACGACMAITAAAVTWMWVSESSSMHPSQNTLDKVPASMLVLPAL